MATGTWVPRRMPARRLLVILAALVGVVLVVGGGSLLPAQDAQPPAARAAAVGRTTTICTVSDRDTAGASPSPTPSPSPTTAAATTSVSAVALQPATPADGQLTGAGLDGKRTGPSVKSPGKGASKPAQAAVVLTARGAAATTSAGAVLGTATSGPDAGLSGAPCLAPATTHWFPGVGAREADRTELVLTNPDDAQAEVDLRFFGRRGRVVVPGSPGLVVDAHSTRTVSLGSLVKAEGPLGVSVQASEGRVTAVAKRVRTDGSKTAGADWQVPSSAPARTATIPAVPDGEGSRQLVVTNPGLQRATVQVLVLGLQGAFAPSGADTVEVAPESSAAVELSTGLAGEAGTITLTSDQPVTGAVVSSSVRAGSRADVAVQPAAQPLVRTGLSAIATAAGVESELVVSNAGPDDATVSFEVLSYDGVSLRTDEALLPSGGTATRRLTSPAPSYVVVHAPAGASIVAGMILTQGEGPVAGLSTLPLLSPDVAGRAPREVADPTVGR